MGEPRRPTLQKFGDLMKKMTVRLPDDLAAFIERKKAQATKAMPVGEEDKVSTSKVIEGLVAFWRALEVDGDNQHKNSDLKQGEEEGEPEE